MMNVTIKFRAERACPPSLWLGSLYVIMLSSWKRIWIDWGPWTQFGQMKYMCEVMLYSTITFRASTLILFIVGDHAIVIFRKDYITNCWWMKRLYCQLLMNERCRQFPQFVVPSLSENNATINHSFLIEITTFLVGIFWGCRQNYVWMRRLTKWMTSTIAYAVSQGLAWEELRIKIVLKAVHALSGFQARDV